MKFIVYKKNLVKLVRVVYVFIVRLWEVEVEELGV